jgi:hypothetical protein
VLLNSQAFAAAARTLLREYSVTLLQLEQQFSVKASDFTQLRTPPAGITAIAAMTPGTAGSSGAAAVASLAPLTLSLQQMWCILQVRTFFCNSFVSCKYFRGLI